MEWIKVKEQYIEVIEKELEETQPTIDAYDYLTENGYDTNQAIDVLTVYFHTLTMEMLQNKEKFNEEKWTNVLKPIYRSREGDKLNRGKLTSLLRRIEKQIGKIESGKEEEHLDGLMYYETQILNFSRYYGLHSNDITNILKGWIVKLYGDYTKQSYNLIKCMDAELDEMAMLLERDSNPYINEDLAMKLEKEDPEFRLEDQELKDVFYTSAIQYLQHILVSVDFWNKQLGKDGYLKYLANVFLKDGK